MRRRRRRSQRRVPLPAVVECLLPQQLAGKVRKDMVERRSAGDRYTALEHWGPRSPVASNGRGFLSDSDQIMSLRHSARQRRAVAAEEERGGQRGRRRWQLHSLWRRW